MNLWNSTNSMFGSNNSSNSTNLYSLLSERASLSSGTYKRLLSSYFSSQGSDGPTTSTHRQRSYNNIIDKLIQEKMYPTLSEKAQEANTNLTSGLNSLNSSLTSLQKDSTYEDTKNGQTAQQKVADAVKSYVTNYNNVVKASKGSTLTNKTKYVANMMSYTAQNADKLAEIGITINRDRTIQLDEKKLKNVDISKVQQLFSTNDLQSYGSLISSRAKFAGAGSSTSTEATKPTGESAAALKADSESLASSELFAKIKDKDGSMVYDVDKILSKAKSFISNYNKMFDDAESSSNSGVLANLNYIREKTKENTDTLKEFGISVDKKGRLEIDEDTFKKADMSKVQDFFKNYGSYVASNASRVSYYMNTNANATNSYTSKASYNVPPDSDYYSESI